MKRKRIVTVLLGALALLWSLFPIFTTPLHAETENDASFVEIAKLVAGDGKVNDHFGNAVALSGDVLAVGAPDADGHGAVYIFVKPADGWNSSAAYAAKLIPSDGAGGDAFGAFVALEGDTVLVGSYMHDVNTSADRGQAYVFVKPVGGWQGTLTEDAILRAKESVTQDYFGVAVAISEAQDVLVVGAHHADAERGAGYVFVKPPGGWSGMLNEDAKLTWSGAQSGDFFGRSLDISGDTIVVGAYGVNYWEGHSYVYVKPVGGWNGTLTEDAELHAAGWTGEFGSQVAMSGDTIVVGSYVAYGLRGMAYVYVKPVSGWQGTLTENALLEASDGTYNDFFAYTLAMDNDRIVAGAYQKDFNRKSNRGAAYVFDKPATGWNGALYETAKLLASDGRGGDEFGLHVGVSGDTVAAGARLADISNQADRGAVYLFAPGTNAPQADIAIEKKFVPAIRRNENARFVLSVKNLGPQTAQRVVIADELPQGLTVLNVTSAQAACNVQEQMVRCTKNRLKADKELEIVVTVAANATVRAQNCATVSAATGDPKMKNNRACADVRLTR